MRAVGGDRRLGQSGRGDLERADLDLDAAELDALVVLELAVHGQERARRQCRDRLGEAQRGFGRGIRVLTQLAGGRVHQLHGARLIAEDDELHLLLVADGLDPARYRDRTGGETLQAA